MRNSKSLTFVTVTLVILFVSGFGSFMTPAAASTTTYTESGDSRPLLERANNPWSSSITSNNTLFQPTLPGSGWTGYQFGTTFTSIARNADFVPNGQFTGSPNPPWSYLESGDTSYLDGLFAASPPVGTTTGSDYITLTGKTTELKTLVANANFTSSASWTAKTVKSSSTYGTYYNQYISASNEWEQRGTYTRSTSSYPATVYANMYCDQNFTVSGATFPLLIAALSYKTWVSNYAFSTSATLRIRIIFSYFPTPSSSIDTTVLDWTPSGTNSKPTSNTFYDLTTKITSDGKYRVRLWTYVSMTNAVGASSTLSSRFDDVGVYIRHSKFSSPSQATWGQISNFGQYAVADGKLSFKYYTDLTTIDPATDSYLSAWIGSNRYDISAFSSLATGGWQTATASIPCSVFNGSATIAIKVGVYIGSNLQILTGNSPRFYFDNVTFYIKYKPTPASIKLGIYDDANSQRNNATGTYGSGSLTITPSPPRSTPWSGASATFHFVTNGTNGKTGYNSTSVTYSYTSTMYVSKVTQTDSSTFTVHDDTRASWYCSYSTPPDIGGYQYYNISIYIPVDWIQSDLVSQIKFGGIVVTNYATGSINSSTSVIKIPAEVFAPNPPKYLLEIWAYSPNYLGPSQTRTLLFSQGNTTNIPGSRDWINATSFISKNITRLACYLRDIDGFVPLNVNLFAARVQLYNESGGFYLNRVWSVFPFSNGTFFVELNPWTDSNVTSYGADLVSHAISWYFAVNWTNNYEAANGIARFTTNSTLSRLVPTTLTSPRQPYTAIYPDGFTFVAMYVNARNGTGLAGATVTWRWINQNNISSPITMTQDIRGNYTAEIDGAHAHQHPAPPPDGTWIQINASLGGYVFQSIQARVFVRDVATTGSASSFVVPYQTYAWNSTILTSLTYTDLDHGPQGITNANLYMNNTWGNHTMMGASGLGWYYNDLEDGSYRIVITANATQFGLTTWSFTIKANKSHYQSTSIYLNGFNVRDRLTTHTEPSLSITTPWADNATFLITYRDTDASGAPILGAIGSSTWTTATGKLCTVTPLGNGTYRFSLNVTGLAPQTYSFSFGFSKLHWATISTINAQVVIRRINTDLSSLTNTITLYWGENETAVLVYKDLDHNLNISLASWDAVLAYDKQTGSDYSSSLIYSIYINPIYNSWIIRVNGSLPVGNYTLWIHASVLTASGYYVDRWFYPTLNIKPLATSLTQKAATLTVVWSDLGTVVVNYTDTVHGQPISGASVIVLVDPSIEVIWYYNGTGIYTIFLNTTSSFDRPQPWPFTIQLVKIHYTAPTISGSLLINAISTSIQVPTQIAVPYGTPLTFKVFFEDLNHTRGIFNAQVRCNWTYPSWKSYDQDFGNGTYLFNLDSTLRGEGLFTILIEASITHYRTVTQTYSFIIGIVSTSLSLHYTLVAIPWGDNASVYVLYRDLNRSTGVWTDVYGPVTVTTNWSLTYWLTPLVSSTGEYWLKFNTTGLPEGIYTVEIVASKDHYKTRTLNVTLTIRAMDTSVTSFTYTGAVPWGDNVTVSLSYLDVDHLSQGIALADIASNWTYTSASFRMVSLGTYSLSFSTSGVAEGNYTIVVSASRQHYADQTRTITITVRQISTSIDFSTSPSTSVVAWGDNLTISISYLDVDHQSVGIVGGSITCNWTLSSFRATSAGRYSLSFSTSGVNEGTYVVVINASTQHYAVRTVIATFTVRAIGTSIEASSPPQVYRGSPVEITITYKDRDHADVGISNASVQVQGLEGIDPSYYRIEEIGNGQYKLTLDTGWIADNQLPFDVNITFSAGKTHYSLGSRVISVKVVASGGFSPMMVMILSGGSGGIVVFAVLGYIMYRRAKIPFVIKKIDQSIKLISKGEMPQPVPMRARTEIVEAIFQGKLAILSKEKIEELEKKAAKAQKVTEVSAIPEERVSEEEQKAIEETGEAEPSETDVDLIAKELERLESKVGKEPSEPTESAKGESEEPKETKKKKDDAANL